jgi:hypothetical protein
MTWPIVYTVVGILAVTRALAATALPPPVITYAVPEDIEYDIGTEPRTVSPVTYGVRTVKGPAGNV